MLVLSRRPEQEILFPSLGITLTILKVQGSHVKIGIKAPVDISIVRGEVADDGVTAAIRKGRSASDRHKLANQFNGVKLALALFQKQQELGRTEAAATTFARVLNLLTEAEQQSSGCSDPEPSAEVQASASGLRLVIVEDDPNERELLASLLRLEGHHVESFADGLAALDYLHANDLPDLVLLDMMMPRCDGKTTIHGIRQSPRLSSLRVVAISGMNPSQIGVSEGPRGVDAWIPKPLDASRLVKTLTAAAGVL